MSDLIPWVALTVLSAITLIFILVIIYGLSGEEKG